MTKNDILEKVIRVEGGYVNDKCDSGGETMWGITEKIARANGYSGEMCKMPVEFARDVYAKQYWGGVCGDALLEVSAGLACEVVDTAVNCGVFRAVNILQKALNALNCNELHYGDLVCDGIMGGRTLNALKAYADNRDVSVLVKACNCLQGAFYIDLSQERPKDERFVYGWIKNRV